MVYGESRVGSFALRLARDPIRRTRERPRCRPRRPADRRRVLDAVTEAMVALHERYHGRTPASAKTQLLGDDLLVCVLGDVYTDVEKTMIELQRNTMVQETRSAFQRRCSTSSSTTSSACPGRERARVHLQPPRRPRPRDRAVRARTVRMILGLCIALVSALGTNVSALFKARGAGLAREVEVRHPLRSAAACFARDGSRSGGSWHWSPGLSTSGALAGAALERAGSPVGRARVPGGARRAILRV